MPSGVIRFEIHSMTGGHELVLDGAPAFAPVTFYRSDSPEVETRTVQLAPGQYLLHCTIPSHSEVGERAILDVSDSSGDQAP